MEKNSEQQELNLSNRSRLTLSGVEKVFHFHEELIKTKTNLGNLEIRGVNLFIEKLDLERHELFVTGEIRSLTYLDKGFDSNKGFLGKLLK